MPLRSSSGLVAEHLKREAPPMYVAQGPEGPRRPFASGFDLNRVVAEEHQRDGSNIVQRSERCRPRPRDLVGVWDGKHTHLVEGGRGKRYCC